MVRRFLKSFVSVIQDMVDLGNSVLVLPELPDCVCCAFGRYHWSPSDLARFPLRSERLTQREFHSAIVEIVFFQSELSVWVRKKGRGQLERTILFSCSHEFSLHSLVGVSTPHVYC